MKKVDRKEKTANPGRPAGSNTEEKLLVLRCQHGDTASFEKLIRRHQASVFALACSMVCVVEDARDICQDSFVKAFTKLPGFDPEYSFRGWLLRITYNTAIDYIRRKKCFLNYLGRKSREEAVPPVNAFTLVSESEIFSPYLRKLNPKQRSAVLMKYDWTLGYTEIGEIMGCSPSTVSVHVFHAKRRLKQLMTGSGHLSHELQDVPLNKGSILLGGER